MTNFTVNRSMYAIVVAVVPASLLMVDMVSVQSWIMLTTLSLTLPLIVLRFWNEEPTQSVAELLHATESER